MVCSGLPILATSSYSNSGPTLIDPRATAIKFEDRATRPIFKANVPVLWFLDSSSGQSNRLNHTFLIGRILAPTNQTADRPHQKGRDESVFGLALQRGALKNAGKHDVSSGSGSL